MTKKTLTNYRNCTTLVDSQWSKSIAMWRVISGSAALYLFYPLADPSIQLHYQDNPCNKELLAAMPSLQKGYFWPTPWLANGHLQSLFGATLGSIPGESIFGKAIPYRRELIALQDGGTLSIDWAPTHTPAETQRILVLFHGVTGGSEQQYIRNCVVEAQKRGYRVGVLHMRGVNQTIMTSHKITGPGASDDVKEGLEWIHTRYPQAPIVAIGTSLGANIVLKYAAESQLNCLLKGIVVVSCPFDLLVCSLHLRKFLYKFSDHYIARALIRLLQANQDAVKPLESSHNLSIADCLQVASLYEFDEKFTRRVLGYHSVEQFYRANSCSRMLHHIRVPVFALSALDDPVITAECIPVMAFANSPNLILALVRTGGHVCFYTGWGKPRRWYPVPALEFLDAVLATA